MRISGAPAFTRFCRYTSGESHGVPSGFLYVDDTVVTVHPSP